MAEATKEQLEQRGEQLKERVYITFTALAVVLALRADVHRETVGGAAGTLTVAVVGTLLAVFLADVVAHITVHQALPTAAELRHMVVVVLGAAETLVLPLLVIGLAALGLFSLEVALTTSMVILVATLVVVGYLAVRRLELPIVQLGPRPPVPARRVSGVTAVRVGTAGAPRRVRAGSARHRAGAAGALTHGVPRRTIA